jgi:hypothetical protein
MLQVQEQQAGSSNVGMPGATIPMGLRILAIALRGLFIGALVAVTVRVSSPQSESLVGNGQPGFGYSSRCSTVRLHRNRRRQFRRRCGDASV